MLLVLLRRVSSGEQVAGTGLARQSASAEEYAKARGWTLHPEIYSDEGVSGFSGANLEGDLGRFLKDLKRGHFGTTQVALGIEALDRLSRQFTLAALPMVVDDLLGAGVTISVMARGKDISSQSIKANPWELHELLFEMQSAHEFSNKLSSRIGAHRNAIRDAIREGKPTNPGAAPSWIDLADDRWVLNKYAATIRRVIAMAQAGDGAMTIARTLNSEKVPPPGLVKAKTRKPRRAGAPAPKRQPPKAWDKNSVLQVLRSPALHGARLVAAPRHNEQLRLWREDCSRLTRQGVAKKDLPKRPQRQFEEEQADYYPALLTPAEHSELLDLMARRRTSHTENPKDPCRWIGQRLTRCICGAPMTATSSNARVSGGRRTYRHLRCTGKRDGSTDCSAPLLRLEQAQAHLLTRIKGNDLISILQLDSGSSQQRELAAAKAARATLLDEIESLEQRQQSGEKALVATDDPAVMVVLAKRQSLLEADLEAARKRLRSEEQSIEVLTARPPIEQAAQEVSQAISEMFSLFAKEEDEPQDRRAINDHLNAIGLRIVVDSDEGKLGLAIGDGEISWQPLAPIARRHAMEQGMVDPVAAWDQPGIASAVVEPDGTGTVLPGQGELPDGADPAELGYQQGISDAKALIDRLQKQQNEGRE